jgi:hypothetical protein
LLAEARENNRKERASAAADSERLAARLDEQNEAFVQRTRLALTELTTEKPAALGHDLSARQIDEERERKEVLIGQLREELAAVRAELSTSRSHLEQRISEVSTLNGQVRTRRERTAVFSPSRALALALRLVLALAHHLASPFSPPHVA